MDWQFFLQDLGGGKYHTPAVKQDKGSKQKLNLCASNGREENGAFEFSSK